MKLFALTAATLMLGAAQGAAAQKVYRCGPDGRIYQQTPCAEGQAVDASDTRTAEQRQAAQAVARREAKSAARLDAEVNPAPAVKTAKAAKAASAPVPKTKPVGSAKSESKQTEAKPLVYLLPAPKAAASGSR
jgi:hypothetical protein